MINNNLARPASKLGLEYIKSLHDRTFLKTTKKICMHLSSDYYVPTRVHSTDFIRLSFRVNNFVKANRLLFYRNPLLRAT